MAMRVIFDCDAGTDDAVALMIAINADKRGLVKLEAITCVSGNTSVDNVAKNVMRILEAAGRTDIPVYKGCSHPILKPTMQLDGYHGQDGFGDLKCETDPDISLVRAENAPMAIGNLITSNPGEITFCGVAPLTNLAFALRLFPNLPECIKDIFIMGGNDAAVGNQTMSAEFNFYGDPEAASITLEHFKCPITIVTWETCLKPQISYEWRFTTLMDDVRAEDPVLKLLTSAEHKVYEMHKWCNWNVPDAFLMAAMLFPDTIVKAKETYNATVELRGEFTRGQMVLDHLRQKEPNVTIIHEINEDNFKQVVIDAASPIKPAAKGCACPSNPARNKQPA